MGRNETRLDKMERTWVTVINVENSTNSGYDHYLGPLRPALKLDEEKFQWRFVTAVGVRDNTIGDWERMGVLMS